MRFSSVAVAGVIAVVVGVAAVVLFAQQLAPVSPAQGQISSLASSVSSRAGLPSNAASVAPPPTPNGTGVVGSAAASTVLRSTQSAAHTTRQGKPAPTMTTVTEVSTVTEVENFTASESETAVTNATSSTVASAVQTISTATGDEDSSTSFVDRLSITCYGTRAQCPYQGSIYWQDDDCMGSGSPCANFTGPFNGNMSFPIPFDECAAPLNWNLTVRWPSAGENLTVKVFDANKTVVRYQNATVMPGDYMVGAYQSCSSDPQPETLILPAPAVYYLDLFFVVNDAAACQQSVGATCGYNMSVTWDPPAGYDVKFPHDPAFDGTGNRTYTAVFAGSDDWLNFSMTMNAPPNMATLGFQVRDQWGDIVYSLTSADTSSSSVNGTWYPSD